MRLLQQMRLAILVDWSTNFLSGFGLDRHFALNSLKVAAKMGLTILSCRECLIMSGRNCCSNSPSMFQAVLGNAKVAGGMFDGG